MKEKDMDKKAETGLDDFLKGLAVQDNEVVTVELTVMFLQQFSFVPLENLSNLKFTCIAKSKFINSSEDMVTFEPGVEYPLREIGVKQLGLGAKGDSYCYIHHYDVAKFFVMRIASVRFNALKEIITQKIKERREKLKKLSQLFLKKEVFEIGDTVVWKEGLCDSALPMQGEPCVVIEIIDPPITCRTTAEDQGGNKAGARNDIVVAVIARDDVLHHFLLDSRRLTKI